MLILFGFKSCGKTYFGKKLSENLLCPFIDLDEEIQKHFGDLAISEIYKKLGELGFRDLEEKVLQTIPFKKDAIFSVGGGTLLRESNLRLLEKMGTLVYLKTNLETIKSRLFSQNFPAFLNPKNPEQSLEELFQTRTFLYEKISSLKIDLTFLSQEEVLSFLFKIYKDSYGI